MTESQIQSLIEKEGALLNQFLFIIYYTNPNTDRIKLIVDDGSIKLTVSREKFMYLFNELLQPRTFAMEKNFQKIKASLNSYGKWYYYDRLKDIFKELLEMPEKEKLNPSKLFENTSLVREVMDERFKATAAKYQTEVIDRAPIPKENPTGIINKFFSYFKELNRPKRK